MGMPSLNSGSSAEGLLPLAPCWPHAQSANTITTVSKRAMIFLHIFSPFSFHYSAGNENYKIHLITSTLFSFKCKRNYNKEYKSLDKLLSQCLNTPQGHTICSAAIVMLPITALLNLTDEPPVISTPPSISACSALNSKLLAVPILAAPGADEEEECNKTGGQNL